MGFQPDLTLEEKEAGIISEEMSYLAPKRTIVTATHISQEEENSYLITGVYDPHISETITDDPLEVLIERFKSNKPRNLSRLIFHVDKGINAKETSFKRLYGPQVGEALKKDKIRAVESIQRIFAATGRYIGLEVAGIIRSIDQAAAYAGNPERFCQVNGFRYSAL
ncbi:MAG: hypothetical protein AABW79_00990 [Nanoarchaeota archaeon]